MRRVVSLDLIRTVAALMVVMIHCSSPFVKSFETASREFVLGNFFDGISRAAVPLFVMTSGALLLDERREFSVKKFYGKNVKNLVLLLVFWSAFYAVLYQVIFPLARGEAADVPELIHNFVFGHYHMWYLYMAVGLYLITPFLRCVAVKENAGLVRLFLGISLAAQFTVPLTQALAAVWEPLESWDNLLGKFRLQFFCGFTAYYLASDSCGAFPEGEKDSGGMRNLLSGADFCLCAAYRKIQHRLFQLQSAGVSVFCRAVSGFVPAGRTYSGKADGITAGGVRRAQFRRVYSSSAVAYGAAEGCAL